MTDQLPPPAPRPNTLADPTGSSPSAVRSGLAHPAALFVVTCVVGVLAALAAGVPIGVLVGSASGSSCSPSDGWCGLGAAVLGVVAGVLSGFLAYVVAGTVFVYRHRPAGRRVLPILAHLAAPFALLLLLGIGAGLTP